MLIATETITVSSDQKKQNSPLPPAAAVCLVDFLVVAKLGTDPRSDSVAVVFWPSPAGASCARKGWSVGLMFFN